MFLAIVGGALAVRLFYLWETADVPFLKQLAGDALGYWLWGMRIAQGEVLGSEPFYQAPLYPYFLGLVFAIFGSSVSAVRVVQAILGSAGCGLLALGTARLLGSRAGWVAGIMLALYPPAVFFDGIVQKAPLDGVLTCLLFYGLVRVREGVLAPEVFATGTKTTAQGQWHTGTFLLGAICGLLCLTRENALVWVPLLAAWAGAKQTPKRRTIDTSRQRQAVETSKSTAAAIETSKRQNVKTSKLRAATFFMLGVALVLMPVGVRNVWVSGEWSFSTFQAGPNFYIGNHRGADGRYQPLVRGHETPEFERADATRLAQEALGRELTAREVSRYWMSRALDDVRSDPWGWLRLMGRKLLMVGNRYEISDVESQYVYAEYSWLLGGLGRGWHFGVLLPLAAAGLWSTRRGWRELWVFYALIASMVLAIALFFVLARYRFVLVPLLVPFGAVGLLALAEWVGRFVPHLWKGWGTRVRGKGFPGDGCEKGFSHQGQRPPMTVAAVLGVIVVALVVNRPVHDERRLNAMAYSNLAAVLGAQGDLAGATRFLQKAVEGHPDSAEARFNLGYALSLQGNHRAAAAEFEQALRIEPTLINADYLLGVSLEKLGETDAALRHYRRAVELDPNHEEARAALARLGTKG